MSAPTQARQGIDPTFVRAARWLRADGWRPDTTDFGGLREFRWRKDKRSVHVYTSPISSQIAVAESGNDVLAASPTSIREAVDHLVVACILPAEFASWNAKPSMYERAYWDIQLVLDEFIGAEIEDGAGAGIAQDVRLLGEQRDAARLLNQAVQS